MLNQENMIEINNINNINNSSIINDNNYNDIEPENEHIQNQLSSEQITLNMK